MIVFVGNGYPCSLHPFCLCSQGSQGRQGEKGGRGITNCPPPLCSWQRIRRVCKDFNIRVVFKFGPTLHSLLTEVKDPLPTEKQASVIYKVISCTCRKLYIGMTKRRLETHLKEHKDACIKGFTDKSAIAEHAQMEDYPIHWDIAVCQSKHGFSREGSNLYTNSSVIMVATTYPTAGSPRNYKKIRDGARVSCIHLTAL